ncbi:MAG: DNA polymerase III subunit beta [Dehalococcoidia bacterium]
MWVTCLQENLSRGLATVGRAVAARATLPVTQNVLIQTDDSRLKLTATNLEIAISTWIGAQIESEGAITIPARMLTDFVNSLPNEKVMIELIDEPKGIRIKCDTFTATINGTDAEEFPPIPTVEDGPTATIPADGFRGALDRVVFAAASDDSRPVLTGVKVELDGEDYTLAAADGFRLAVEKGKLASPVDGEIGVIVPARTMSEVGRLLGSQASNVQFTITEARSQALFKLENVEVVTQLVQGTFPDYEKLIPTSYGTRAKVDLHRILQATRASSIFARDGSGIIRLVISPGQDDQPGTVKVTSRAEEMGDNEGVVQAAVEGEESKVAFNSKFLIDVLNVMDGDEVALETTTPSSPGVFRAGRHEGYTHVVMPMFVQW